MQCSACGTSMDAESRFCPHCGLDLNSPAGASPAGASPGLRKAAYAENDVEADLWRGGFSAKCMYGQWLLALLLSLVGGVVCLVYPPFLPLGGIGILFLWGSLATYLGYRKLSVGYRLTDQRLQHEQGLLLRRTDRIETIDIDDVTVTQGPIERMFGVGTICLTSSDRTDPELRLSGIDDVQRVAKLIDDARRQERRRRGVYVEQV